MAEVANSSHLLKTKRKCVDSGHGPPFTLASEKTLQLIESTRSAKFLSATWL